MKRTNPEVDSKAAPCAGDDALLREAMQNLRPPISNPTPAPAVANVAPKSKKGKTENVKPAGLEDNIDEVLNEIDLKEQPTVREVRFIELRFVEGMTTDKAMIAAGYGKYSPKQRYRIATKIVQKYEHRAGDHRKIMRAMGYGETKIIEMLIDSAENAKSEMVRLGARTFLAKCLGMQQDVVDMQSGIRIIVNAGPQQQAAEPVLGGGRPALIHQVEHKALPRSIEITR
jgi:hypothetical protein